MNTGGTRLLGIGASAALPRTGRTSNNMGGIGSDRVTLGADPTFWEMFFGSPSANSGGGRYGGYGYGDPFADRQVRSFGDSFTRSFQAASRPLEVQPVRLPEFRTPDAARNLPTLQPIGRSLPQFGEGTFQIQQPQISVGIPGGSSFSAIGAPKNRTSLLIGGAVVLIGGMMLLRKRDKRKAGTAFEGQAAFVGPG